MPMPSILAPSIPAPSIGIGRAVSPSRGGISGAGPAAGTQVARDPAIDQAAREFEKLLVHRLLKDMRKTNHAEAPSNARATWDDLYDEKIAGLISQGDGLGLQDAIARSLESRGGLTPSERDGADRAASLARGVDDLDGLDGDELTALRALVARPITPATATGDAGSGPGSGAISGAATAANDSPERRFVAPLRAHAERNAERLGTTADAILAVAALESGWGRYPIVDERGADSNNLFGIKTHGADVPSVTHLTTEFLGTGDARRPHKVEAEFRRYGSVGEAVDGFADFVLGNPRYAPALAVAADPEAFLEGLQAAGYATDPAYADKAIRAMHRVRAQLEPHTLPGGERR